MKKLSVFFLISTLFVSTAAQDFKTVRDGIEYAEIVRSAPEEPLRINLLRLDLKKVRLDVAHGLDTAIGLEKTSSIAVRNGAFAAVNAGFFRLDMSIFAGDAVGVLKIDGKIWSESYADRSALGIINGKNSTTIKFGHLGANGSVGFGIDGELAFSGINRERKSDEIVLFTPDFYKTTLTEPNGTEIILRNCRARNGAKSCSKTEVLEKKGSSIIPPDGFVISIGPNAVEKSSNIIYFARQKKSASRSSEKILRIFTRFKPLDSAQQLFFSQAEDIISGVPQLIRNGRIEITWEQEKSSKSFVETRHPRTAVARLKDGKFLMLTVDGRQPDTSVGMSLPELAEFLLKIGAIEAMNLDGGGSTTMFLDGRIVNRPSDKEGERRVSNALLVFPRSK